MPFNQRRSVGPGEELIALLRRWNPTDKIQHDSPQELIIAADRRWLNVRSADGKSADIAQKSVFDNCSSAP